jgi:hypothetical protein
VRRPLATVGAAALAVASVASIVTWTVTPAYADNCSGLTDCSAGVKIALALLAIVLVVVLLVFAWEFVVAAAAEEAAAAAAEAAAAEAAEAAAAAAAEAAAAEAAAAEAAAAEQAAAEAAAAEQAAAAEAAADQAALDAATTEAKLGHIFQAKHGFEPLVDQLGSETEVVKAMLNGLKGQTPASGRFVEVVNIAGQDVTVRGAIVNGIVRITTAFIPH